MFGTAALGAQPQETAQPSGFAALGESLGKLARRIFASSEDRFVARVEERLDSHMATMRFLGAGESREYEASFEYLRYLSDERVRKHPKLEHRIIQEILRHQGENYENYMALPSIAGKESLTPRQRNDVAAQVLELYRAKSAEGTGISCYGESIRNAQVDHLAQALYALAKNGVSSELVSGMTSSLKVEPRQSSFTWARVAEMEPNLPPALAAHLRSSRLAMLDHPAAAQVEWCGSRPIISNWIETLPVKENPEKFLADLARARKLMPGGVVQLDWWVATRIAFELPDPSVFLPELKTAFAEAAERTAIRGVVKHAGSVENLRRVHGMFPAEREMAAHIAVISGNAAGR